MAPSTELTLGHHTGGNRPSTFNMSRTLTLAPGAIKASSIDADGKRRCWSAGSPAFKSYHDSVWGHSHLPGSGQLLYKQLILQTFQSGLSWSTILAKESGFFERFEQWDYSKVAKWKDTDISNALADPSIVRNSAKVRAAVANAVAATTLDKKTPFGFEKFCWANCGGFPDTERLLQHESRSGSHMRGTERVDFASADGVHPTPGVMKAVQAFKEAGFQFIGPATMLSFLQASGFVNHHKPDCSSFTAAETSYAAGLAAFRVPHAAESPAAADPESAYSTVKALVERKETQVEKKRTSSKKSRGPKAVKSQVRVSR